MSKNWISDKLWRLAKVLYFLLSFLIIVVAFVIIVGNGLFTEDFDMFNWWKLIYYIIYILLWHATLTVFLWMIARYIRTWDFTININWIKSKKLIYFAWVLFTILLLSHFISYKIDNFCSGDHEKMHEYEPYKYQCGCDFGYKRTLFSCVKSSDEESFTGLNENQIQWIYNQTSLLTWGERLDAMEKLYNHIIWPVSFKSEYMTWWVKYQTWGISISHPPQIFINDNKFNEFKIYPNKNIYISKETFESLVWKCIEYPWIIEPQSESEEKEFIADQQKAKARYTKILKEIMNSTIKEWAIPDVSDEYLGRFDPHSCWFTKWPINLKKISVDGINWVVIDYNATQDDSMDCITVLFKEVLLVKSMDEIYKITFDYNFWKYWEGIIKNGVSSKDLANKWSYYEWELCLYDKLDEENGSVIKRWEEYIKTWEWNVSLDFKVAVDVVNEMIKSIQII